MPMADSTYLPPSRMQAEEVISSFTNCVNKSTLLDLAARFSGTYSDLAKHSLDQFLVTPVTALPTGREQGKFICIDVGGTNLRVGFIELLGESEDGGNGKSEKGKASERIRRSYDRSWPIGDHLKMDQAEDLFAWIGGCIAEAIQAALNDMPDGVTESPFGEELLLGITFSFPMSQKSLSEATLLPMGKGFAITSNLNLGKLLLAGYSRYATAPSASKNGIRSQLPKIRIAAITNDTVATFTSLAYAVKAAPNSRVAMGLIVGTGTNATVPMKLANLHTAKRNDLQNPDEVDTVVVNTEWTINGTERPLIDLGIQNHWDRILDRNTDRPGFQPFEYMTAGRYLGEIVRLAFVYICEAERESSLPPKLELKNAISTRFLSEVVAGTPDNTALSAKLEVEFPSLAGENGAPFWSSQHIDILRSLATAVQQRSSALIAAACVGLLDCVHDIRIDKPGQVRTNGHAVANDKTDIEELVVAYAGSTISQYPNWLAECQKWIDVLVAEGSGANVGKRVLLKEASNGSIIGAGVLAGMTEYIV
ncbi:hexokinase-2 [Periconia macrospinosa]|uniref:Phosphotransferase n=1 Tax=Periconia macrospinosa TaxID=97972 RepID=A0A2V1DWU3_9PLEO|nr:hexokinase-2 [Periconia macrospinosa]